VSGAPTPFSKVTEEDQELMTPEEYSAYFEVFQSRAMAG
jgi:transcription initiation factor TFIIE subunit alpha